MRQFRHGVDVPPKHVEFFVDKIAKVVEACLLIFGSLLLMVSAHLDRLWFGRP